MSWNTYYQRKSVIDAVLAEVAKTLSVTAARVGEIPAARRAEINEVFGGEDEFLLAVHYRWANILNARLDPVLESAPDDTAAEVRRIWQELADEQPATICLLARYSGRPALARAIRRQQDQLAWAPGVDIGQLIKSGAVLAQAAA